MPAFDELPTDLQDLLADWPAERAVAQGGTTMTTANATTTTIDWGQLHEELARPFPDALIKYRVGAISKDKAKAQALPYVDPRAYEDRLNELVPGAWSVSFEPWGADRIICRLTIHGVTRSSTGDGAGSPDQIAGTAAEAQAFKRACAKFGLGRHLYDRPVLWMAYDATRKTLETARSKAHRDDGVPDSGTAGHRSTRGECLGHARASKLHLELARQGIPRSSHVTRASDMLDRTLNGLHELTEDEARLVWKSASSDPRRPTTTRGRAQQSVR